MTGTDGNVPRDLVLAQTSLVDLLTERGVTLHAPVNHYRPNPFGLYNVHGNVYEWCLDGYDEDFYASSPKVDPVASHAGSLTHAFRGGTFDGRAFYARSAARLRATPGTAPI